MAALLVAVSCALQLHPLALIAADSAPGRKAANPVSLSIIASRTGGVAPLAVFFDATGTTDPRVTSQPFHDILYTWSFGEAKGAGAGTWRTGARAGVSSRNAAYGPVAAHIYEQPGTYTVALTAFDGVNTAKASVQITVDDPEVVFWGPKTICISASGDFDGCPDGASRQQTSSLVTALGFAGTGRRLLFRRGESWSSRTTAALTRTGPGILGAFGAGAKPVWRTTIQSKSAAMLNINPAKMPGFGDWRIVDIDCDGERSAVYLRCLEFLGPADQTTLLRVDMHDIWNSIDASAYALKTGSGARVWDEFAIQDSTFRRANISAGVGQPIYASGQRFSIQGTVLADSASHVLRIPQMTLGVIQNSEILGPADSCCHLLKLHAPCHAGPGCDTLPIEARAYTEKIVISDNVFAGAGGTGDLVSLAPQNSTSDERLRNIIFERNWIKVAGDGQAQNFLSVSAVDVTVRNNLFDLTGGKARTGYQGIYISRRGIEPGPDRVRVYNNTFYSGDPAREFNAVKIGAAVTNAVVKNNLAYGPNAKAGRVLLGAGESGLSTGGNSSDPQMTGASPHFAAAPPAKVADFTPTGGYAADGGVSVPVWNDFGLRRITGARSIGAWQAN